MITGGGAPPPPPTFLTGGGATAPPAPPPPVPTPMVSSKTALISFLIISTSSELANNVLSFQYPGPLLITDSKRDKILKNGQLL